MKRARRAHPGLSETEVKLLLIKERMAQMTAHGKWQDKWLLHPFPHMSEPQKAVCYLTDCGDYDPDHLAWLYSRYPRAYARGTADQNPKSNWSFSCPLSTFS